VVGKRRYSLKRPCFYPARYRDSNLIGHSPTSVFTAKLALEAEIHNAYDRLSGFC